MDSSRNRICQLSALSESVSRTGFAASDLNDLSHQPPLSSVSVNANVCSFWEDSELHAFFLQQLDALSIFFLQKSASA